MSPGPNGEMGVSQECGLRTTVHSSTPEPGADNSPQPFDTFGIGLVCKGELVEGAIECLFTVTSPSRTTSSARFEA